MRRAALLVLALAGCAARAPASPAPEVAVERCHIRPVRVTDRDFFSLETRREIRRVNRDLRRHCAG